MQFVHFNWSIVALTETGNVVMALFAALPAPLVGADACVGVFECSRATFEALCSLDKSELSSQNDGG